MGSFDWDQMLPEPDVLGRCFHELFKVNPDQQRKRSEWKEGGNKRKFSKAKEKRRMKVDLPPIPPPSLFPQQIVFGGGAGPGGVGLLLSQPHQYYLCSNQTLSPPDVTLPGNASTFAAFATVRMALLDRRNKLAIQAYLSSSSSALALSASQPAISPTAIHGVSPGRGTRESDGEDETEISREAAFRVPKIVGIGLRSVFELIRESRAVHPRLCTKALGALLDVIQGQAPEGLKGEPSEVMDPLFELLLDLATSHGPESAAVDDGSHPTAVACACLLALVVATGATPRLLSATAALLTSPRALAAQHIHMPQVLASLQRSVQEVLLHLPPLCTPSAHQPNPTVGTFSKAGTGYGVGGGGGPRPDWMTHGVQKAARIDAFRVSIPSSIADSVVRMRRGIQLPIEPPPAIASDGQYIYIFLPCTNRSVGSGVLLKVGSGYGATVRGHTYLERPGPHPDSTAGAWLGFASGNLYFKPFGAVGKKGGTAGSGEVLVLDRDSLRVTGVAHLGDLFASANGATSAPSTSAAPPPPTHSTHLSFPCVIFSDGENLGAVTAAKDDGFVVRILNPTVSPMSVVSELPLKLARKCLEVVGTAPLFGGTSSVVGAPAAGDMEDEGGTGFVGAIQPSSGPTSQGTSASGSPVLARTIQTGWEEEVASIAAGKDFALIRTASGKVLYCGKASSLGIKQPQQQSGLVAGGSSSAAPLGAPRIILSGSAASASSLPTSSFLAHKWSELPIVGLSSGPLVGPAGASRGAGVRIAQVAVGHEGQHVVLLTEEGIPLFAGTARRGEDGDQIKARRQPKATKPKRMVKAEGHEIVWAACNNGTTALVSSDGLLMLFGKDTAHCDHTTGVVSDLRGIRIVQVALGKAHAVALTAQGHIYTFGINNKGQCGRDYCPSSIPSAPISSLANLSHQPKEVIAMETAAEGEGGAQGEEEEEEGGVAGDWEPSRHQVAQRGDSSGAGIMCPPGRHKWRLDQCMVCTVCRECTGYSISCLSSIQPDRNPGQECGCGEGDSGCSVCGCCRICARENVDNSELAILGPCGAGDVTGMVRLDLIFGGQHGSRLQENLQRRLEERKQRQKSKMGTGGSGAKPAAGATTSGGVLAISTRDNALIGMGLGENEQDGVGRVGHPGGTAGVVGAAAGGGGGGGGPGSRVASLPPARINIPDDSPVMHIACGLHHTVLLLASGVVYTFGSNSHGQLGVGDLAPRGGPIPVRLPPHPPPVAGAASSSSQQGHPRTAVQIAAGSNHTVILTVDGEVFTFGSFQKGQLGRVPVCKSAEPSTSKSVSIHLLATEMTTPCAASSSEPSSAPLPSHPWNSMPGAIPGIGPRHGRRASWIGASAEHTFIRIEESLINAASLSRSTLLANRNCILLLPTGGWDNSGEESVTTAATTQGPFHCLTIARREGSCTIFSGREQVHFTGTAACLDPVYNVIWSFSLRNRQLVCYNAVAAVARGSLLPYASSPRDSFCDIPSILSSELALPVTPSLFCPVRRSQAALHLLGCLDTLTQAHEAQWWWWRRKGLLPWRLPHSSTNSPSPAALAGMQKGQMPLDPMLAGARRGEMMVFVEDGLGRGPMVEGEGGIEEGEEEDAEGGRGGGHFGKVYSQEDFSAVNRFESNGGGWGYAGQSVEAIRFSADTDILLGGFGLFGGRGDYIGKIKLFDIGMEGGEREGKGELLAETDDLPYECGPRQKYPMLFDDPIPLQAARWYVAWARVTGPSSDCGSNGQAMVTTEDQVTFYFKSSKKSNNGTDVNAGQIPQILYRVVAPESEASSRQIHSSDEPVHILSREFSRTVSRECFQSLISLLQWSWNTFKAGVTEATMPPHFRSHPSHQRSASHPPTPCTPFLLQSSSSSPSTTPSNSSSSSSSTSPSPPGQPPRLTTLVDLHRLVYISRSSLRLLRTYTNEIYPNDVLWRCISPESSKLAESVGDVRALLRQILLDPLPPPLGPPSNFHASTTRRASHSKSKAPLQKGSSFHSEETAQEMVGSGQEMHSNLSSLAPYWQMTSSILDECHRTFVACFHAFYPTPALKWTILCHLLSTASAADNKELSGSPSSDRLLSAVLAALCSPSIRLRSTLPLLGNLGIGKGGLQEGVVRGAAGRRSPSPVPPPAPHSPSCCSSSVSSSEGVDGSESDASDSPTSSKSSSTSPTSFASSTVSSTSSSSTASFSSSSSSPERARRKKHRHCKDRKRRAAMRTPAITVAPSTPPSNAAATNEAHYYPMLVEHMNYRSRVELGGVESVGGYWSFRDVLEHLLMLITTPIEKSLSKYSRRSPGAEDTGDSKMEVGGQQQLVHHCCNLLSRVVAELASQSSGSDEQVHGGCGGRGVLHATPCRFAHSIQGRSWNTGNGSPDALCFSVDRPGIAIAGVGLYGGTGQNEYELEILVDDSGVGGGTVGRGEPLPLLLQHQSPQQQQQQHLLNHAPHNQQQLRQMAIAVIAGQDQQLMQHHLMDHQAPHTQRWTGLEVVRGSYGPHDLVGDIFEVKFDKAVPIKENVKYVIRLRNHGGKTSNGDGGLSSVRGPDGTTFSFSSSSLSFNGTTQTRGQIPHLLYYSNPQDNESQQASRAMAELEARRCTLWIASAVVQRCIRLAMLARRCVVEEEEEECHSNEEEEEGKKKGKRGKSDSRHKGKQKASEDHKHQMPVEVLSSASIVTTLLPLVLAHVGPVAVSDPKSSVQVLGLIRDLLPHIAALNNSSSALGGTIGGSSMQHSVGSLEASHAYSTTNPATITTSNHYAWVESEHPYKPATVSNYRVSFPDAVKWLCIEFDSRCGTAQAEDTLQLYIPSCLPSSTRGAPSYNRQHSRSTYDGITGDEEFGDPLGDDEENVDDADDDMDATDNRNFRLYGAVGTVAPSSDAIPVPFWPVLRKFSGSGANGNWPSTAVVLPGNEVIFSLETASDYVKDERGCTFGFRCLVVGYEWSGGAADKDGLRHLESELAYLGGMCAASLMRKDLALPVSASVEDEVEEDGEENFSTVMKKGASDEADGRGLDLEAIEEQAKRVFAEHSTLLGMGFALSTPPTIVQALDGSLPFSCHSNERLFLSDFVRCASGTSGGRLSWWLQPESYVDPRRCEAILASAEGNVTLRCGWPASITLLTRDQYGDVVHTPSLLVEVKAIPIEKKDAVGGTSPREGTSIGEKQPSARGVCLGGEGRDADSGGSRPRKLRRVGKHRHHHHHHHHHKHQQRHKTHVHHQQQQQKSAAGGDLPDASAFGGHPRPHLSAPYEVTVKDKMCYHAVTIMKAYEQYSFEELRYASPSAKRCAECLLVRSNGDGTYSASWTPSCAGWYSLHMTVDGYPVEQTYKVEVREPPQGMVPPTCSGVSKRLQMQQQVHHSHHGHHHHHHHGHHSSVICNTSAADPSTSSPGGGSGIPAVSSNSSASPSSRLRRFVAKNSAGLRIRAHPSLQSEQIGVVHVNGTVAFVEEIHNDDGVWLRLSPDTVRQYCGGDEVNFMASRGTPGANSGGGVVTGNNAPGVGTAVIGNSGGGGGGGIVVSEAWCLQYNQHLGRTLLVPTEEPKSLLDEVIRTTILRNIPQRGEGSREQRRIRGQGTSISSAGGPGTYQVVRCGASGHNVRSRPSLKAPPVGMLELGNQLSVAQDLVNSEGTWVRLDGESMQKFCFNTGGEAWSLARSRSDVQYLQGEDEDDDEEVAVEVLSRGVANPAPIMQAHSAERELIHDARPHLSSGDLASSSPYPSPKRAFDFSSGISSSSSPRHRARQRHISSGASSSSSVATAAPPPFNFGGTGQPASSALNGVNSAINPFVFGSSATPEQKSCAVEVSPALEKVDGAQKTTPSHAREGIGVPGTPGGTSGGSGSKDKAPDKERESSKFAALQKWLKGEETRTCSERRGSPGRDLPPELVGVSVKELVKAIGESRANGNGVTPPGTPPRRTSRSSSPKGLGHSGPSPSPHLNSRSSSPGVCSVAGTGGVGSGVGAGTAGVGGGSQRRGSAHSDTTSALVSSLTRDLSQSPSGSSSVLTRSADSPNGILAPPPPSLTSQPIGIPASSSMHRDISGDDKDPTVESPKTTTQTGTQTSPEGSRAHFSIGSGGAIGGAGSLADQSLPLRLSPKLSRSSKQLRSKRAMSPASAGCSSRCANGIGSKDKLNSVKDTFKEVPPMPSPVKEAMSPSVAECLRAAFAALLWHEGVVHDAMACASFLKFHPGLPKNGAVVVARDGTGTIDLSATPGASMEAFVSCIGQGEALTKEQKARQRHSVEVSMGTYLHIQPSSPWMPELIGQDHGAGDGAASNTSRATTGDAQQQQYKTVTVLPPALKALVTLWEEVSIGCLAALSRQGPVSQVGSRAVPVGGPFTSNQAVRKRTGLVQGGTTPSSPRHHHHHHREKKGQRKKKEWKTIGRSNGAQGEGGDSAVPYWEDGIVRRMRSSNQMGSAWCELCGGLFPHPVTHHMRAVHPGCGAHSEGKGYNSIGQLVSEYVGSCGDGGVGEHLWYLMCEACREKYIGMRRRGSGTNPSVRTTPGRKSPSAASVKMARKKASSAAPATSKENLFTPAKASLPSPIGSASTFQQGNVHHFMRSNAAFLLDLASAAGTGLPPAREATTITSRISTVPGMGTHHKRRRRRGDSMPLSGPIPPPPSSSSSSSATSMPVVSEHGPPPSNRVPTAPSTSQFAFFELPPASSSSSNSSTPSSSSVSSAAEPPFQCLKALGVHPSQLRTIFEERLLEETLRRNGERGLKRLLEGNVLPSEGMNSSAIGASVPSKPLAKGVGCDGPLSDNESEGSKGRTFHRSISMGTTARESWNRRGGGGMPTNLSEGGAAAAQGGKAMGGSAIEANVPGSRVVMRRRNNSSSGDAHDTGSSLLCYASPALQKLVMPLDRSAKSAHGAAAAGTAVGSSDLLSHPVLMFLLQQHDLQGLQLAMRQALRRATCRVYAMQALNWLLRNVTQPVCLHDLLWWFVVALSPSGNTTSSTIGDHNLQDGIVGGHGDDNRPGRKDDVLEQSRGVCDHPLSDVSVGGEAVDPLQESFHSLLQTVADLMLLLPMGSPLQTMAIRCWGIRFRTTDHAFLHRSHVFSNISKILSRSEEDQEEGITSSMHESHTSTHSYSQPVSSCVVEALKDLTGSVEMKASSRQAMVGSLCDNSTETFWESGDEDRNKTKTITILCQPQVFPRTVYVHIDNCRDLANKVSSVTFQSGINLEDLYRLRQVEVESRSTGWVSCPILDPSHRVIRLEVKGPDNSLRLRQVRVLGEVEGESLRVGGQLGGGRQRSSMTIQQRCCETETLRVFRLITSQVFGKLILGDAGEHGPGKVGKIAFEDVSAEDRGREGEGVVRKGKVTSSGAVEDDSNDLKEHMVGILFSRSKLTHLQRQVCAHIVQAIRKEAVRVREEWEALLCSGPQTPIGAGSQGQWMPLNSTAQQLNDANKSGSNVPPTDTYCFEMLSMVLALSGSSVGRAYLSHQYGLLSDLLSLLHTGSARVQRQVTSLLRRMLPEVSPAALASILSIDRLPPADFGVVPHHQPLAMTKRSSASFHTSTETAEPAFDMNRVGILDVFLSCIAKALTVQVKVKGKDASIAAGLGGSGPAAGTAPPGGKGVTTVTLATCIHPRGEQAGGGRWWLRGCMNRKLAEVIIQLLKDMAQGKLSDAWAQVTKGAVAEGILNLTRLGESVRTSPNDCLRTPTLWLALASLCVLDQDHARRLSSGRWGGTSATNQDVSSIGTHGAPVPPPRPTCTNHDDGETTAIIQCNSCGNLCADCDRFLHLHRKTRMHQRQVCKEEEEAIKVDLHEGCGRTKLFWVLALADSRTLKAMVEFRRDGASSSGALGGAMASGSNGNSLISGSSTSGFGSMTGGSNRGVAMGLLGAGITGPARIGSAVASGVCRFCGTTGNSGLLAIGNVCADHECQEHARNACSKLHPCGHLCGGIAGESPCLPCLHGCAPPQTYLHSPTSPSSLCALSKPQQAPAPHPPLKQDADDMCMICFTEALSCAPAIQLKCGHVFHLHCCRNVLMKRWAGPRITFSFAQCPICKADVHHSVLEELLSPVRALMEDVRRKALMRLEYEGLHGVDAISAPHGRFHGDPAAFAMDRYAYYVCYKCNKAYYGGEARCDLEAGGGDGAEEYDPAELVCGACSDVSRAQMCPKHGTDFLEYKCRYCCSVAVFFCFGTTHFCNACHDDFQRVTNIPRHELPHCPAGPKAKQLDGEECPLHVAHPPTGEEFALGCGVCRNAHTF